MSINQLNNFSQSFIFNDLHVRGNIVKLTDVYEHIASLQDVAGDAADLLGQVLAAAAMLIQPIKTQSDLTLQFESDGDVKLLAAKIDTDGNMRATMSCNEDLGAALLGKGFLVVTVNQHNIVKPHQSIIEVDEGQSIRESLEKYFVQSEQMPTLFFFACNDEKATGIMIQQSQELVNQQDWVTLSHLFSTVTVQELLELDSETILFRLFNEFNVTVFPEKELVFKCTCTLEKMQTAIMSLGEEDALEILQTNRVIEVVCDYCKNNYSFDKSEINQIFNPH